MAQFQQQVNIMPAPGVAGDFCSANPRASVLNGPGDPVAGANGVAVGTFVWGASSGYDNVSGENDAWSVVNNTGAGVPLGFIHREQQALITAFLGSATMVVPQGVMVTVHSAGDFWVNNAGTTAATAGMKAYANNSNGTISFAATGSPPTAASVTAALALNSSTASTIAVNTAGTCTISGTTLTIGSLTSGGFAAGQTLTGTNVAAGTTIVAQLTGTVGGSAGATFQVNISQTVASTTITASGGMLTVGGTVTGTFFVGQVLTTGAAAGTTITALISGAGGAGTYAVNISQTVASTTITGNGGTLTVSAVGSGTIGLNDVISGGSITAGTYIQAIGTVGTTGAGGTGTYITSTSAAQTSTTVTVLGATETKWYAMSQGAVGELVKMSSWAIG